MPPLLPACDAKVRRLHQGVSRSSSSSFRGQLRFLGGLVHVRPVTASLGFFWLCAGTRFLAVSVVVRARRGPPFPVDRLLGGLDAGAQRVQQVERRNATCDHLRRPRVRPLALASTRAVSVSRCTSRYRPGSTADRIAS